MAGPTDQGCGNECPTSLQERGIYAASPFYCAKAFRTSKRHKCRGPSVFIRGSTAPFKVDAPISPAAQLDAKIPGYKNRKAGFLTRPF
jgi:hypothetical protein